MDLEKIKQLMAAMEEKGLTKLFLKEETGVQLLLERRHFSPPPLPHSSLPAAPSYFEAQMNERAHQKEGIPKGAQTFQGYEVTSPMVGTFYSAPSPEADPFVKVGDVVTEESIIGVIEAMKVMNEIKAGKKGIVTEILIENAHPVEFGTKLLRLA